MLDSLMFSLGTSFTDNPSFALLLLDTTSADVFNLMYRSVVQALCMLGR